MIDLSEIQVFACFYIIGIIIGVLFDFFKSLRKEIKHKDKIVLVEDIIFLLFSGILVFIGIFKINYGVLRLYIVLAIILGMIGYSLTISRFFVIIFSTITRVIYKIFKTILNIFEKAFFSLKKIIMFLREYFNFKTKKLKTEMHTYEKKRKKQIK